jgi:hypothetical protein
MAPSGLHAADGRKPRARAQPGAGSPTADGATRSSRVPAGSDAARAPADTALPDLAPAGRAHPTPSPRKPEAWMAAS